MPITLPVVKVFNPEKFSSSLLTIAAELTSTKYPQELINVVFQDIPNAIANLDGESVVWE